MAEPLELQCPMCQKATLEVQEALLQCPECNWSMWRSVAHRALSDAEIRSLVTDGETKLLKGFKAKTGNQFSAILTLTDEGEVKFRFPPRPEFSAVPVGKCPKCGADVVEREKTFSCSAWKETHCDFGLWKQVAGHNLTREEATKLLAGEKVGPVKNLKGKSGKSFSATFTLDKEEGRIAFEFEPREDKDSGGRRAGGRRDEADDDGEDE